MDLFEYQAKELFAEYGVPIPQGKVASTPEEARQIAEDFAAAGKARRQAASGDQGPGEDGRARQGRRCQAG